MPGIAPTIILMSVLSLGNVLNAGFDQIYNLYSPLVYETGDIIDTFVYRLGIEQAQYSPAAVGIFKSGVSFILIVLAWHLADKLADYRIFWTGGRDEKKSTGQKIFLLFNYLILCTAGLLCLLPFINLLAVSLSSSLAKPFLFQLADLWRELPTS